MEGRQSCRWGTRGTTIALRIAATSMFASWLAHAEPSPSSDDPATATSPSAANDPATETSAPEAAGDGQTTEGGSGLEPSTEATDASPPETAQRTEPATSDANAAPSAEAKVDAAPSSTNPTAEATPAKSAPMGGPYGDRNIGIALTTGYLATGGDVFGLRVEPHGFNLGVGASYTWDSGLWLGVEGRYFFGSEIEQVYLPPLTTLEIPMTMKSSLASVALAGGFEHAVGPIVVRYGVEVGVSIISWDMGDLPFLFVAGYPALKGTLASPHLAPGVGVVLPIDWFFVGLDFRYRLELGSQIPGAAGGHLATGVRF